MGKHTPGPWQAKNEREWDEIIGDIDGPDNGQHHYTHICSVDMDDLRTPEYRANARLIAAAPELLEALREIVHAHDMMLAGDDALDDAYAEMQREGALLAARAAIAKAEGA